MNGWLEQGMLITVKYLRDDSNYCLCYALNSLEFYGFELLTEPAANAHIAYAECDHYSQCIYTVINGYK